MAATILVIEDDLEINELIGEYLALESIRYLKATSGKQGLQLAAAEHPDAVILDLMLPDVHGFDVARSLATHRTTHDIPIVILSCMCQQCDKEQGFAAGALTFMNKPFLPDDLLAAIRNALAWKADLPNHPPVGTIELSPPAQRPMHPGQLAACSKGINQMTADLFEQTDLSDSIVASIREGIDLLREWEARWTADHANHATHATLQYHIKPRAVNGSAPTLPLIEWILHEDAPGMIEEAFFKPAPTGGFGLNFGSLIGWGGQSKSPAAPPQKWLDILAKTGAVSFEKDTATKTVRFARMSPGAINATPAVELNATR